MALIDEAYKQTNSKHIRVMCAMFDPRKTKLKCIANAPIKLEKKMMYLSLLDARLIMRNMHHMPSTYIPYKGYIPHIFHIKDIFHASLIS